ncbi:MAG: zinc ribbon domain-containing protein [Desulfobacterales bacterium]|nr:zinc ribbon domain-containing protein [Desulfobacterales bacterium]
MPIYEYHCSQCDRNFEYLVIGKSKPECPACHSKEISRMISACGFISKESGGETVRSSGSSCAGCSTTSCKGCGH